jgi:hypothetical protein
MVEPAGTVGDRVGAKKEKRNAYNAYIALKCQKFEVNTRRAGLGLTGTPHLFFNFRQFRHFSALAHFHFYTPSH